MYEIEKTETEVIVRGPNGYQKRIPNSAVGVVLRRNPEEIWDDTPRPYTIQITRMTELEIVSCAVDLPAYVYTG
jgi:hypothetical protein